MRLKQMLLSLTAGLASMTGPAQEEARQDASEGAAARGEAKSLECVACHGPAGVSPNPTFPHLAGQNATYLQMQLDHFQSGKRYHPLMTPVAKSLSTRDMADLAIYFSRIGQASHGAEEEEL